MWRKKTLRTLSMEEEDVEWQVWRKKIKIETLLVLEGLEEENAECGGRR